MKVEVPEERIAAQVRDRLQQLARTTRIQGFRPGKAPLKVIQQRFGQQVRREVIGAVLQESFLEAVDREQLRPAGAPRIEPVEAAEGAGLRYTARFEVLPDVQVPDIAQIEVEKVACEISEADVDRMVETLRKQRARLEPADREARNGDVVDIDFHGTVDGEPFEGGHGHGFKAELGAGRLMEGFEAGLVGRRAGEEVKLELTFPEDAPNEKLRGKPVVFEVKVNSVLEPVLPELNDEFFRNFGVQEGGEEAFRREVREHMEREAAAVIRNRCRDSVMDSLYRATTLELPRTLVEQERERMRQRVEEQLKAWGIGADAERAKLADPALFEDQARKRVTLQLVVNEIIRQNSLRPDPARVRETIERNAQSYEDPSAIVSWYYADPQRLAEVEAMVLEDEVIDWITARARVRTVSMPFDELVNKRQTESA